MSGPFGFPIRTINPYPNEYTLLFWHDLWKTKVEAHGADWREQSWWVNRNIPEFRAFNSERYQKPWLAIRAAYEAKCQELEQLKEKYEAIAQTTLGQIVS